MQVGGVPKALLVPLPLPAGQPLSIGIDEGWIGPGRGEGLRSTVGQKAKLGVLYVLDEDRGSNDSVRR